LLCGNEIAEKLAQEVAYALGYATLDGMLQTSILNSHDTHVFHSKVNM
jgi:hypothetical protein